jgi:hypothetical protein
MNGGQADEDEVEARPRRPLRRGLIIAGSVIGVLAILLVGTVLYLRSRDSTTEVSVDDAVGSFREADGLEAQRAELPVPGVYEYETVGEERIDSLGGSTHVYPPRTTMTYTHTDCGYQVRWDAFEERFDELDLCISPEGEAIDTTRQYREFFGFANDRVYQCDASAVVRAASPTFGETRSTPCTSPSSDGEITVTVIGLETIEVGGQEVEALHVLLETTLTGDVRGTSQLNYWTDPITGLDYRREFVVSTEADSPLGVTNYDEEYTVQLVSLSPRQ